MSKKNNIFKSIRDQFALIVFFTTSAMLVASILLILYSDNTKDLNEKVFFALLPMFGTWIGTVIAFYFGKENFNAASKIFKNLSPDILDDVTVKQIMIATKTMVIKTYDEVKDLKIEDITKYLTSVTKSRLPVLHEEKPKYIIHESLFLKAKPEDLFSDFEKINEAMITGFITAKEDETLESVRKRMTEKGHCKNVFVVDNESKVTGWLTDTLILRYLNSI